MDHFLYRNGHLFAEDVAVQEIAGCHGTPLYVYATATLNRHFSVFREAFEPLEPLICYAVKANGNLAVTTTLARFGAGADVVSEGELAIALAAGVPADRIVFSGVGKTDQELKAALEAGILQINVESEPELEALSRIAQSMNTTARIAIRINPDVDALTHEKISTGLNEAKFGIEWTAAHRVYAHASRLPGIQPVGLAVHIGSQLTDTAPFEQAFLRLRDLVAMLRADGHHIITLDLGGGLGVPYGNEAVSIPSPRAYAEVIRRTLAHLDCRLILEPGRLIVGNAGLLVTRVLYVKEGATRTFVIVDAGMNDLMRPAIYDAYHAILPVAEPTPNAPLAPVDVVGPVCETSDCFAAGRSLPPLARGDLLAIKTAGAYGAAMGSFYNARPLCAEVIVSGHEFALVRHRIGWEHMRAFQRLPEWLTNEENASVPLKNP
ncbi:MAG: diaminopimelate decarboxylase [Hyphomicrobiales bacterium]|nr:diaminopimelate decarboxylase [Hyphomicrobiales bacterium]